MLIKVTFPKHFALEVWVSICFGCSNELSHCDGSFEYPQHMFWLKNKNVNFLLRTLNLSPDNILFILQAFSEFTFEPSGGELRPLESKKVKVTFQPVSAKSVRRVIEELRIIFCLFYRPLVSLHLSHPVGS